MENLKKCCFCGKEIGILEQNDPWPANSNINDECCSLCNQSIVIPSRMALAKTPAGFRESIDYFMVKDGMLYCRVSFEGLAQLCSDK